MEAEMATMNEGVGTGQVDIRDAGGNQIARLELDLGATTPDEVITHLRAERLIMDRDPQGQQLPSALWMEDRELVADRPLAQQQVRAGSVLSVQYRHVKGADWTRLQREQALLAEVQRRSEGRVSVEAHPNLRHYQVTFRVRGPVRAAGGPYAIADVHLLEIWLPDEYPAAPPLMRLATPVLVPNCFASGQPCVFSDKDPWHPVFTLVEVVQAVAEVIQGVRPNMGSIADNDAAELWERRAAELRTQIGTPYRVPMVDAPASTTIRVVATGDQARPARPSGIRTV
jgi:ubiquitin-conjugating enzyme E2 N